MCVGGATRGRVGSRRGITRSARCRRPRRSCAGRPCPPSSARPGSRKDLGERPTKGFGRRLSVSIACLFWVGRRRQPALRMQIWSRLVPFFAIPMVDDEGAAAIAGERRESLPAFTTSRHRAHARAATALSPVLCAMSLIVTRHHPTITTLVVLGALGSGRIGGLGQAGRAPLVPVATCPKIQLQNLVTRIGPGPPACLSSHKTKGREVLRA